MELFDVLDEKGRVIGKEKRSVVHKKGLLHRSVYFLVLDREFRILVNQRSMTKEFFKGYWSISLGGHPSSGESYEEAVKREVLEETGIKSKPFYIVDYKNFWLKRNREIAKVYGVFVDKNFRLDENEIKQGIFLAFKEAKTFLDGKKILPETGDMINIVKDFLKKNGKL
jgi:isopentenyldiphosphate isomerase